jgi:hypothetical protein
MWKFFRILLLVLVALPIVLFVGFWAQFIYRTNSCAPGDHVIPEADAIEVAKKKIIKSSYFSSETVGSAS